MENDDVEMLEIAEQEYPPRSPVLGSRQRNLRQQRPADGEGVNQIAAEQNDSGDDDDEDDTKSEANADNPDNTNKRKEPDSGEEEDADSGQSCPICMDLWSNSGEHRLCSLRCGHLFGHSCIIRWLQTGCNAGARRCPQCNHKAAMKDIRVLYAKKLSVVDTGEIDKMKEQLSKITAEKNRLEIGEAKWMYQKKLYEQQIAGMRKRIAELEREQSEMCLKRSHSTPMTSSQPSSRKFHLERSLDISKEGGCRVLAYNPWHDLLVVSQKSANTLFSGFGIRKIDSLEFRPRQFVFLHSQAIRDISFHPTMNQMLLSVGFDKCAKLMDIQSNTVAHSYQLDSQLWSCCWSGDSPNIFLTGAQNGSISQFDIRQTSGAISTLDGPGDRSPVVSLAAVPPNPGAAIGRGGFIACRLNTFFAYERKEADYCSKQMFLEGPFVAVSYDSENKHILVSSRPNPRHPQARHVVCTIEKGNEETILCNIVHTFHGGSSYKLLSRPCHITTENDTLIAAHQESTSSIPIWSTSKGKQVYNLPVSDPVMDLCSFSANNNLLLATLSEKKLRLYTYGN